MGTPCHGKKSGYSFDKHMQPRIRYHGEEGKVHFYCLQSRPGIFLCITWDKTKIVSLVQHLFLWFKLLVILIFRSRKVLKDLECEQQNHIWSAKADPQLDCSGTDRRKIFPPNELFKVYQLYLYDQEKWKPAIRALYSVSANDVRTTTGFNIKKIQLHTGMDPRDISKNSLSGWRAYTPSDSWLVPLITSLLQL